MVPLLSCRARALNLELGSAALGARSLLPRDDEKHTATTSSLSVTSAGGLEALDALIGQLPTDLAASMFIVQHMAPHNSGEALHAPPEPPQGLSRPKLAEGRGALSSRDESTSRPPDSHLLLKADTMLVRKGARENRSRPGVDPLFRSAAVAHGSRVIGVVLTGMLDDGTAGLIAIKRCGGVTVVQDPKDAAYPGMPQSALDNADVDHCVPIAGDGRAAGHAGDQASRQEPRRIPGDIRTEAEIAERVLSDVAQVEGLGTQVPYNCPNCGGVLWEMDAPKAKRYRCHTGHSFTGSDTARESVREDRGDAVDLAADVRRTEESAEEHGSRHQGLLSEGANRRRLLETQGHIERIRSMLLDPQSQSSEDTLTRVKGLMAESRKARSTRR